MRILFDVSWDVQINRKLLRVGAHSTDASPAFEAIADFWIAETREQFATEGRHASGGWKPLTPATLEAKRRKKLRPEILRATDRMLNSLTVRDDGDMILEISPTELAYGSKVPYVGAHQRPKATSHLPQRRPVEFTETARRTTVKILQRFILTGEVI
jgi:phage gpG-like protein